MLSFHEVQTTQQILMKFGIGKKSALNIEILI